ncbi:membrane protein insertase YidC [Athalassotoga saccharophila]|uniref:membrane protein insertase YidC n=1 Tax=Athalassotoga saccharophila TaxID=1441386 RepID=UPI00137A630C|nr:membrane protein insertase YidC [Athalassotoga saccharophila]BBJ28396.1 membrane protein insertase YidC [Athalassotoga saccharophila]
MTKNVFVLLFLVFTLSALAFAIPQVEVSLSATTATVTTKLYRYSVDLKTGVLQNEYSVFYENVHSWENTGDGLVLYYDGKPLTPSSWSISPNGHGTFQTKSNVTLNFFYDVNGVNVEKSITFVNNPNYEVVVSVKAPKDMTLSLTFPTLEANFNRSSGEVFGSYYSKKGIVTFTSLSNGIFNDGGVATFSGNLEAKVYMGPVKNTLIFSVFPKEQGVISNFIGTYPGSEPWYSWFMYIFVAFLNWLYDLTGNYGWAIILFGIIVRVVLYPLFHVQLKSMLKMRDVQPKIQELQKKYKDPKKLQEEMMKLYKAEGVNPTGGCLPLLIQLPILGLLYYVIFYSREVFAYNPQFLIWNDLSVGGINENIILLLLIVFFTLWSSLWTSTKPSQVWLSAGMSAVVEFIFIGFPVGLFLYYTTFSGMQVLTSYVAAKIYKMKGITWRELFGMNPKVQWGDKRWKKRSKPKA